MGKTYRKFPQAFINKGFTNIFIINSQNVPLFIGNKYVKYKFFMQYAKYFKNS